MMSSATEAGRVVGAQVLQGGAKPYNTAEALVYVGGPTSALLLACCAAWELPAMLAPTVAVPGMGETD